MNVSYMFTPSSENENTFMTVSRDISSAIEWQMRGLPHTHLIIIAEKPSESRSNVHVLLPAKDETTLHVVVGP